MKLKRFALRGLITLAVLVALCMFFARTVQTITTPKVQLVSASTGRFEEKMSFHAQVHFPKTEEIIIEEAAELNVTVKTVYVQPGHYVKAGDAIFTAQAPSYEEDMDKLRQDYDAKARELIDLDIENRKLSKESKQNELYDAMLTAQDDLTDAQYTARLLAQQNGIVLTGDASTWTQQLVLAGNAPSAVKLAVDRVTVLQSTYDAASAAFYEILENKKLKVKDNVFKYINDRNALIKDMDELTQQIIELNATMSALEKVVAPRDGYIVSVAVEAGAAYDGVKAAYVMSAEGSVPVLRASLAGEERAIADDTRADIDSDVLGDAKTSVEKTAVEADGSKHLHILLPEEMLTPESTAVRRIVSDGGVTVNITYRAKKATTLLPPSALRGQEGDYYVYLIQNDWGGFMSSASMKVVKTPVTVLEKSDKTVSISEDLSYQKLADREDRALTDGQTVMEYVQ